MSARRRFDVVAAAVLCAATVLYLCRLPRVLGASDEGLYLYETERLLAGQVFYRDVFDLITPGAHYLMAALFWAFGTSMATARVTDAVMHGLIVAAVYGACRLLGVRRGLAVGAALLDPAVFRPAWDVASPHWLSTLLSLALLLIVLRRPVGFLAGVAAGLVIAVQQQRGALMALGAGAILLGEHVLMRRRRTPGLGLPALPRRAAAFAGGVLLVVVPLGVLLVAQAGATPVYQALVLQPLVNYRRQAAGAPWGYVGVLASFARYTYPRLLAWQPVLTVLIVVRAGAEFTAGVAAERARRSLVLALTSLGWIGSILYFPDYIHLAIIGPVFAILLADLGEGTLALAPRTGARAGGWVLTAGLLLTLGFRLRAVMAGTWRDYPITYSTPFGMVNLHAREDVDRIERVRALLRAARSRELFVYPGGAGWYLWTGTINPTPYQFMVPGYSGPEQLERTIAILERDRGAFVLLTFPLPAHGDVVTDYLSRYYRPISAGGFPMLLRRIPAEILDRSAPPQVHRSAHDHGRVSGPAADPALLTSAATRIAASGLPGSATARTTPSPSTK